MSATAVRDQKVESNKTHEPMKVVKKKDLKREDWGVGTNQFERSISHILTPSMGSEHCWFAYQETPPGRMGQWHHHTHDEFYYVLKGTATVSGDNGFHAKVEAGDTIFIPAYARHQTANEGTETLTFVWGYVPPPQAINEQIWLDTTAASDKK